jgi:hypothetical protein
MTKPSSVQTGIAGEYFVAAELSRIGIDGGLGDALLASNVFEEATHPIGVARFGAVRIVLARLEFRAR